jgi:hypothetical protein
MSNFGHTPETAPPGLRDAYKALEPDANADYGTILPFAIDRTTGKPRWAIPSILRDTLGGGLDLLAGLDTGEVTPRAALQLGLGSTGVGASLAPRGAVAMGGARLSPGEETAARLARARQMGFDTTQYLYHGTGVPGFSEFSLMPQTSRLIRGGLEAPGIWTIENPEVASLFARLRASKQIAGEEAAPNVLPLFGRYIKKGDIDLNRVEYPQAITSIAEAFDKHGFDAARVLNYHGNLPGHPPITGQTAWVFKNPNQLRSVHAAFDPAKRESSDLMAGFAIPGPAPVPGLDAWRPPEPEPPGMIRLPTGQVVDEATIPNHLRPSGRQVY